jgi:hypothetical protein
MGRASRIKQAFATSRRKISYLTELHSPPRSVVRTSPAKPLVTKGDLLTLSVAIPLVVMLLGGRVCLRLLAISFGDVTVAEIVVPGSIENPKGPETGVLQATFVTRGGKRVTGTFPISIGAPPREIQVGFQGFKVAYLEAAPFVAGLVDDFGYSDRIMRIFAAIAAILTTLVTGAYAFQKFVREPRIVRLHESGIAVPIEVGRSRLGATKINYHFEGLKIQRRVVNIDLHFAKYFREGQIALVDPRRPKSFVLYGAHPYAVAFGRMNSPRSRITPRDS